MAPLQGIHLPSPGPSTSIDQASGACGARPMILLRVNRTDEPLQTMTVSSY